MRDSLGAFYLVVFKYCFIRLLFFRYLVRKFVISGKSCIIVIHKFSEEKKMYLHLTNLII